MPKFEDLKFEPLLAPNSLNWVPKRLFEQMEDEDFNIDRLYELAPLLITSPINRFWALRDDEYHIKGVLWCWIDPLRETLNVNILSVDKQYQRPAGAAIKGTIEFLTEFIKDMRGKGVNLKEKITTSTRRPKAYERIGAKRATHVNMEILLCQQ